MLGLGQVEAWRLRELIKDLQAKIANGAIPRDGATSMEVARLIDSAEKQIAHLEQKDEEHRDKEREEHVRNLAIAYKVEQEAALNAEEKQQYSEFLQKEHFTKSDFQTLEKFYTHSYEKLSEGGRTEMSTRVWNGVRRKEYEFIELPDIVKEKEAARLSDLLSRDELAPELRRIPRQDRDDFTRGWKDGNKDASYDVLNRQSFAENVSISPMKVTSEKAIGAVSSHSVAIKNAEESKTADAVKGGNAVGTVDFSLGDVQLVDDGAVSTGAPLQGAAKGQSFVKGS